MAAVAVSAFCRSDQQFRFAHVPRQPRHCHVHIMVFSLFPLQQVMDWFCQMTSAIAFCHSKRVLHRDLKPGNIFLTSTNQVKLGDFGIARVLENTMDKAQVRATGHRKVETLATHITRLADCRRHAVLHEPGSVRKQAIWP